MMHGREHKEAKKACQYNTLGGNRKKKRGGDSPMEISRDEI
jgi:hypothetical protein